MALFESYDNYVSMLLSRLLLFPFLCLLPLSVISTTWLYLYPIFHGCSFPRPTAQAPSHTTRKSSHNLSATAKGTDLSHFAPFRLLALGDPQLEGDSSLPNASDPLFPSLELLYTSIRDLTWEERFGALRGTFNALFKEDIPRVLKTQRKKLDLFGNDYYLAHIYRSLYSWTEPTHVTVLGDLLGSQWISDGEFLKRGDRFWGRVFKGMEKIPDKIMDRSKPKARDENEDEEHDPWVEVLGDNEIWKSRIINIAGNHDIGYAGDINEHRTRRFETVFGRVNWEVVFTLPDMAAMKPPNLPDVTPNEPEDGPITERQALKMPEDNAPPALRLVILNSMNLDTLALTPHLQTATFDFLNDAIGRSRPVEDKTVATILLTHIPLHKEAGICVDDPFFDFYHDSRVKEQNHLSPYASRGILEGIFGMSADEQASGGGLGRKGVILTGHDHEGCDVLHYLSRALDTSPSEDSATDSKSTTGSTSEPESLEPRWQAHRLPSSPSHPRGSTSSWEMPDNLTSTPHLREITLRSMMGSFGGYAGFLSAWFDPSIGERGEWILEFSSCSFGVQHWWWGVHILDLIVLVLGFFTGVVWLLEGSTDQTARRSKEESELRATGGKQKERAQEVKTGSGHVGERKPGKVPSKVNR